MTDDPRLFLERHGYRRCDISACNCGSWHGGHAKARLDELREAFEQDEHTDTRNKTLLNLVCEVLEDRASLKLRAERAEYNHSTLMEQRDRAHFEKRLAENERDAAKADAREAWGQFYALRKQVAELKRLGYLAGTASASPGQLEELRVLCKGAER